MLSLELDLYVREIHVVPCHSQFLFSHIIIFAPHATQRASVEHRDV